MCPLPQTAVESLIVIAPSGQSSSSKSVTAEPRGKMDVSIPVQPAPMDPIKSRHDSSVSTTTSCTLDSGSELSTLDELLSERIGTAMEAVARDGDRQTEVSFTLGSCFEGPSGRAPSISIRSYVRRMLRYIDSGCGSQSWISLSPGMRAFLIALIYMDRLASKTGMVITSSRIHRLIASAMLVALKANEDAHVDMKFFAELAGVSFAEMRKMESAFIQLVDWDLVVSEKEFEARIKTWKRLIGKLPKQC